jgi:branched-chain amino acid transport system ATP-binding protein
MALLELQDVALNFGGLKVLDGVSFSVEPGEVVGLIGPNGAGKTSAMNVITGMHRPKSGKIRFNGEEIQGLKAHKIAALGIRRTFQTSLLCPGLSVLENVMLGMEPVAGYGLGQASLGPKFILARETALRDRAMEMLEWMGMAQFSEREGQGLSFGQQRLVELARALASTPRLLMLDEPAVGLSPPRVTELAGNIRKIAKTFGTTIVLIEHVIQLVLNSCDRVIVMNAGKEIFEGTLAVAVKVPQVIEVFLGGEHGA